MASLSTCKQGNRRLVYTDPLDGKRRTIYLGKPTHADASRTKTHVEALIVHRREGTLHDAALVRWVKDIPDELAAKLASVELIEPRQNPNSREASPTLAAYVAIYLDSKPHLKASTRTTFRTALQSSITALGTNRRLRDVDERSAGAMVRGMTASGYSKAYVAKAVTVMKAMFRTAAREKLVDRNPFEYLKAGSQVNNARKQFIDPDTVYKLIGTLPGSEWPLLVALARWGGLRTPSEPFAMTWNHVLWDQGRLIVPCPKQEHLPGRETRVIPIFPELRPFLDARWVAAQEGEAYIFPTLRKLAGICALLRKRIEAAGLTAWPRTWQNLRASRATELADRYPGHVAAAWLGHTNEIADKHYRSVLDSHYDDALMTTRIPTRFGPETGGNGRTGLPSESEKTPEKQAFSDVSRNRSMGATGFEPVTSTV